MGKAVKSMRRQVISSFYKILILSILATVLTWGTALLMLIKNQDKINPANYYESQIPIIMEYVEQEKEQLLQKEAQQELERRIPLEGLDYQVLDTHANLVYGSTTKQYIKDEQDLLQQLNRSLHDKHNIILFNPLLSKDGDFIGAIGFRYQLTVASANPQSKGFIIILSLLLLLSPFFYFYLFSFLIGRKLSKQMETPFRSLMEGAKKIQHHDLDFQLVEFKTVKELQELVNAFEEMRIALKESLLRQWQIEEERKEMVAAIAHDLRTPLTIIHGHAEGLIERGINDQERAERYIKIIFSSTERAVQLLDQLHTVSTIEHPEFTIEKKSVNITEFIANKLNEFQMLCQEKQLRLTPNITVASEQYLDMDSQRISQVLDNIIVNSIRYCPEYGEIEWDTRIHKGMLIMEIKDNGPGFPKQNIGQVFSKFYREDQSRTGTGAHSGLGLYIAQELVKKHHGSITVQNRPEGGAYTKISIPLKD